MDDPRERKNLREPVLVLASALCFGTVVALHLYAYLSGRGAFPELLAAVLIVLGMAFPVLWVVRRVRDLSAGSDATPSRDPKARWKYATKVGRVGQFLLILANMAGVALVAGTMGDDPRWRAFTDGTPTSERIAIESIESVEEKQRGDMGPTYTVDFTGTVETSAGPRRVESSVSLESDPRECPECVELWAIFNDEDFEAGFVLARSPSEAAVAARWPLHPVVGLGFYLFSLITALIVWMTEPADHRAKMGLFPKTTRAQRVRAAAREPRWALRVGSIPAALVVVYLLCLDRRIPDEFIRSGEVWGANTFGTAIYGVGMVAGISVLGAMLRARAKQLAAVD
ncbi:hypothetical protein [Salininema proteolyticum]|uniref:DUF3592 domain-containing protein n=1 Tax=Salininema proteolyticum TaxID=1607685 RepID=A0ABV8TW74_9ACTN